MAKRELFSDTTKRKAAEKVAYFCSNPNCKRLTIGPNDNGNPHRYGEAAHIYPASYKGPRGDDTISPEYLKSEKNCLWLCNSCHEIIDANPNLYSPELLNEWKRTAEDRAFKFVTDFSKSKELIKEIENSSGLASYFDELFARGDFSKIVLSIRELSKKDNLLDSDKEELSFAQTRFDSFCARKNLIDNLNWIDNASQQTKERLVDFSIKCFDRELCQKIAALSGDINKREFASKIANEVEFEEILNWLKNKDIKTCDDGLIYSFHIVGGLFSGKVVLDKNQQRISYRVGWLAETCDTICDFLYDVLSKRTIDQKRMQPLLDEKDLFLWLDPYYINKLFDCNYHFFPRGPLLETLLKFLIDKGVSTPEIRLNYYINSIALDKEIDRLNDILNIGLKYNDYKLVSYVLSALAQNHPEIVLQIVENNFQLAKRNLLIIDSYRLAKIKTNQSFDLFSFLDFEYEGDKNDEFYILRTIALKELNKEAECLECWNKYKEIVNYDDEFVTLALQFAGDIKDEAFVVEACSKSMIAATLFYAAEVVYHNFSNLDLITLVIGRLQGFIGTMPEKYNHLMFALLCKAQRYEEALSYGKHAYFDNNVKGIAPNYIQVKLNLGLFDEDDVTHDVALNSSDYRALSLLGYLYIRSGKQRMGWDYIARAVVLRGDNVDLSIIGNFIECQLINELEESDDYSYVVLDSGDSFLLLPPEEKEYYAVQKFDVKVYFTDERKDLCFLKKGDAVELDGEKHIIEGVFDYFYCFHRKAMERLVTSEYSISFKSDNIENLAKEIYNFVSESGNKQDEFLASTNGQALPFFMFAKHFGRGLFAAAEALYYSSKRKSFFVFVDKSSEGERSSISKPLFDIESFYLSHRVGITCETIIKDECCITSLTKGALLNEISEKENDYKNKSERGVLTANKKTNKPVFVERTQEDRRKALQDLQSMKKLLDCFTVVSPKLISYSKEQSEVLETFKSQEDGADAEVLEAMWSGTTLISNNKTFYIGQNLGTGTVVDFSCYLAQSSCSALEAIEIIKNLSKTNIVQYLTPDVFNSIMRKLRFIQDGKEKKKAVSVMVEFIKGNWDNSWSPEEIEKHQAIVYLASVDERKNYDTADAIHVALRELFDTMLLKYISSYSIFDKR